MTSVERDPVGGGKQRLKPWQALVALAVGLAVAGVPTTALPLAAGSPPTDPEPDAATAVVVEAVLRGSRGARPAAGDIVKS